MNITYLYQYFNTPEMPGGSRAYEMGRRLVAAGHSVNMITSYRGDENRRGWFITEESGMTVHWYCVPYDNSMSFGRRVRSFVKFAGAASQKAASIPADVVFATSTPLTIALPGAYASWRQSCPMVFEVRDLWPEMPIAVGAIRNPVAIWLARTLERFAYARSRCVVALSPGMAEGVAKAGFPADRIRVIPNSCDLETFQDDPQAAERFKSEHSELSDGPIVLYAGTLGRINRVDYLVQVASKMLAIRPEVQFVILGDGSESEKVRKLSVELGVAQKNYFQHPQVIKRKVVDAFAAASIITSVVLDIPEIEKNSANKFFDGLAAGRPVAINHGGWQADLIRESGAGLVLSRDPATAAEQIAEFLADDSRQKKAAEAALLLARNRFSRDLLAKQLENVLRDAVDDHKKLGRR